MTHLSLFQKAEKFKTKRNDKILIKKVNVVLFKRKKMKALGYKIFLIVQIYKFINALHIWLSELLSCFTVIFSFPNVFLNFTYFLSLQFACDCLKMLPALHKDET